MEKKVYLPKGAQWTAVWTDTVYSGDQYITVEAPLDQIPLFVKNDADILEIIKNS